MTQKQLKAAKLISDNINSPNPRHMKDLLVEAGYTPSTAQASTRIVRSDSFKEILEKAGVTDEKLSAVMHDGLEATRQGEPDHAVRHKYLETAIKVKGHIGVDADTGNTYNTFIQQNNIDPNVSDAKDIVENTLDALMEKMKQSNATTQG